VKCGKNKKNTHQKKLCKIKYNKTNKVRVKERNRERESECVCLMAKECKIKE